MPLAHLLGIHSQSLLSQEATKTKLFVDLQLWICPKPMLKISLKQVVTAPKAFPLFAFSSYLPPPLCCDENQHLSLTLSQQLEHLHCFVL